MRARDTLSGPASTASVSAYDLSDLIGAIYDCTLDPDLWEQTLANIAGALDCQTAALSLSDLRHSRVLIQKSVGIEPYLLERIPSHVPEIHARLSVALASWPSLDEPHVISRHVPPAEREASPYFQECLKPQGIVDIMQFFLMSTPARFSGFGLGRHERQGVITDREIALGQLLLPHLRRAVTISNVLDARTVERARMAESLDALRCGVVLTNEAGTILHANRSAEAMLRDGGPLQDTGGILGALEPAAAKELRTAIKLAASDEADLGKTGLAIRLSGPEEMHVFAHVLPMSGGEFRTRLEPEAVAAVFVGMPDEVDAAEAMSAAFDLTPAETRVLAGLLAGQTLANAAEALGVARSTAKKHLESIFSKTGATRQADLMRLATRVGPPARTAS